MADKQPKKDPTQDEITKQQNTALPGGRYRRPDGTIVDANNVPIKELEPASPEPQPKEESGK